jgi:large subunit ribosomal protein L25
VSEVKINAEPRTEFGKGGARRTRRAGKVPAVLYGHGEKPKHIALPAREFAAAIRHGGSNQLFNIEITDGTTALALPKAIQRDPIKETLEHVDLLIVRRGEKVTVEVALHVTGEPVSGTLLTTSLTELSVEVEATHIPQQIELSVDGAEAGTIIHAGQIALPAGATLVTDPEAIVVQVTSATESLEDASADAEGDGSAEG